MSAHQDRIARKTIAAQHAGAAAGEGKATDEAVDIAYQMGLAGEKLTFGEQDDPRLREAHRNGLNERAKARRRQRAASVASKTGGYLERAGRAVTDRTGDIPTPSGGSVVGVLVGVLGLVLLFLFLNRANLATGVIGGVVKATTWLVSPSVLPF